MFEFIGKLLMIFELIDKVVKLWKWWKKIIGGSKETKSPPPFPPLLLKMYRRSVKQVEWWKIAVIVLALFRIFDLIKWIYNRKK